MRLFVALSCLFIIVCTNGKQIAFSKSSSETEYDIVEVEHIDSKTRAKRFIDDKLPTTIFFLLKSQKTNLKLRLRRAARIDIPTFVCDHGHFYQVEIEDFKKSGVYVDHDTGRPIMVSDKDGFFDLMGSVIVNDNYLNLHPLGEGRHKLTHGEVLSYGADALIGQGVHLNNLQHLESNMGRKKSAKRRRKRGTAVYTVEVLIVTDHSVRDKFLERNNNYEALAIAELKTYYAFTLLGMATRYESITLHEPDTIVNIEGSGIVISNSEDDSPYNRDNSNKGVVQYFSGLVQFTDWVNTNTKNGNLPAHDHAMWFTDHKLAEKKSTSVIGIAWLASMCSANSTSIIEDYFSGRTEHIAAHELGHSLKALHDGQERGCNDNNFFVMAAASYFPDDERRNNPWIFSDCSASTIASFASKCKCLQSNDNGMTALTTSALAGQYLNADEQCRINMGDPNSYFCRRAQIMEMGLELMCQRMFCYDPANHMCSSIVAKDFTSCGNGKWCEKGSCVDSMYAPYRKNSCPQGDGNTFACDYTQCESYTEEKRLECCYTCPIEHPPGEPLTELSPCAVGDQLCEKCRSNERYMARVGCEAYRP